MEIAIESEAGLVSNTVVEEASRDPLRLELPEETPIRIMLKVAGRSGPDERAGVALMAPSVCLGTFTNLIGFNRYCFASSLYSPNISKKHVLWL